MKRFIMPLVISAATVGGAMSCFAPAKAVESEWGREWYLKDEIKDMRRQPPAGAWKDPHWYMKDNWRQQHEERNMKYIYSNSSTLKTTPYRTEQQGPLGIEWRKWLEVSKWLAGALFYFSLTPQGESDEKD